MIGWTSNFLSFFASGHGFAFPLRKKIRIQESKVNADSPGSDFKFRSRRLFFLILLSNMSIREHYLKAKF